MTTCGYDTGYERGYEMTRNQGKKLLDVQARRYLGVDGEEFLRRWDAGEYDDEESYPNAMRVAMLIPFAR